MFKVKSISVKAGSTPLPAIWALETSRDFGIGFEAIRYYTTDHEDCLAYFGVIPIDNDGDKDPVCLFKSSSTWEESESVSKYAPFFCSLYFEFCFVFGIIGKDKNQTNLVPI